MQLFRLDSINRIIKYLDTLYSDNKKDIRLKFFVFGDSLRSCNDLNTITLNDQKSYFPKVYNDENLQNSRSLILLSDGNWINPALSKNRFFNKECYYIQMEQKIKPSYIQIEIPSKIVAELTDKETEFKAIIAGYKNDTLPLSLTLKRNHKPLYQNNIALDSGSFTIEKSFTLKTEKAGISLLELNASLQNDSATTNSYSLFQVIPHMYTVYIYASKPSLDKRFFYHAWKQKKIWKIVKKIPQNEKMDLILFFDWDIQAKHLLTQHPHSSEAYIGCIPDDKLIIKTISTFNLKILPEFKLTLSQYFNTDFPPPSHFITAASPPYQITKSILTLDDTKHSYREKNQNIPLLFEAQKNRELIFVVALKGIWRWDFWPKSIEKNSNLFSFSHFLSDHIHKIVSYNKNRSFYVFPSASPIYENDSLDFTLSFPSYLNNIPTINMDFTLISTNSDTMYSLRKNYTLFKPQTVTLKTPPVKHGKYSYICNITTDTGIIEYSDSISIFKDIQELQINGQNKILLNEVASPLPIEDLPDLISNIESTQRNNLNKMETIQYSFRFSQSWWMLLSILFLLFIEWFFRRLWKYD
ncbi:MAG: hypothetical protein PVI26_01015 [Chitinispirillia bacterium]|jgi:hypothetical protein